MKKYKGLSEERREQVILAFKSMLFDSYRTPCAHFALGYTTAWMEHSRLRSESLEDLKFAVLELIEPIWAEREYAELEQQLEDERCSTEAVRQDNAVTSDSNPVATNREGTDAKESVLVHTLLEILTTYLSGDAMHKSDLVGRLVEVSKPNIVGSDIHENPPRQARKRLIPCMSA